MAMSITEACIGCGVCLPECPNGAIDTDDSGRYFIRFGLCTECLTVHERPRCLSLCPIPQCIEPSQRRTETKEDLMRKVHRIAVYRAFKALDSAEGN
jgi:Fe-S-cluster-containing hydrogenase component 2